MLLKFCDKCRNVHLNKGDLCSACAKLEQKRIEKLRPPHRRNIYKYHEFPQGVKNDRRRYYAN